ncbi:MAG: hypothetical protein DI556_08800 [Rhodovulum sulfidophilum]|uniref:Secretin/TonB short N-terminal domain-containing protein n=1 Tax=Rhodovulum sulfidophilum TaxID=35806 RepID=A0A2W5N9J8_RHOSU|nr:MAG: hypothetical protein DI556_08800 [Rhodovulum sulfidophilum]
MTRLSLLLTTALCAATLTAATAARAQVATAATSISIPAGALEPALLELGRQAGLVFAYDSALTRGRTTGGASGSLSAAEAVARVLAGTGLGFEFTGPRSVRVTAPLSEAEGVEGALQLGTIDVSGLSDRTEGTGLYTTEAPSVTATGLALTARETPQSVSVITNQRMIDQGSVTLTDVINQTPGISAAKAYGDARWSYTARGNAITNTQYDGLTQPNAWWAQEGSPDDMVIYDRVEVVRGATGLMDGPGSPSASVNLVRKRPLDVPRFTLEAVARDYGQGILTFDGTRPLNASGSIRGRLVAQGIAGDSYEEAKSRESALFYGAVDIDLAERTTLGLGFGHQRDRIDGYAWGGFWLGPDGERYEFDATDNPGLAWEYLTREQDVFYADLTHEFENGWDFRLAGRWVNGERTRLASLATWDDAETLSRSGSYAPGFQDSAALGATVSGAFELFGRSHEIAFGADWAEVSTGMTYPWRYSFVIEDPTRPDTWAHAKPSGGDEVTWDTRDRTAQWGGFVSGRFELADPLHLVAGARLAWYDHSDTSGNPQLGPKTKSGFRVDAEPIPYVGLVYDLNDKVSLYASYTEVFRPQSERSVDNTQLSPATGSNAEIGAKAEVFEGRVMGTLALFDTQLTGLPEQVDQSLCPLPDQACYRAAERVSTQGGEIEITGAVTERWNLMASYTYAYAKYAAGPNAGQRYAADSAPVHVAKLSTTYDLSGGLAGLTVGGAVRAQSGVYSDGIGLTTGAPFRIAQGGYAIFDLMARYAFGEQTALQVNVDNLFDRLYQTEVDSQWSGNFFGAPRTVSLTLRHMF